MKTTNEIIRGLREDHDLRQVDVAKILNITQKQYSRYETGENELPTRHLKALSNYYNVSADYILGSTEFRRLYDVDKKKR